MRILICAGTALAITALNAVSVASDAPSIPPGIQALLKADDTVLALKSIKPFGGAPSGTAVVVRHAQPEDAHDNPCELLLLTPDGDSFHVAARNRKIVDCRYNEAEKASGPMGTQGNLTLSPTSVAYFNELSRGGTTYAFSWAKDESTWHLQHVEATSVQNTDDGVAVYKSVLDYPSALPWIALGDFDPTTIRAAMMKNRKAVP